MAFESVNYQCPACGGPLHFASAEQKLVCDYCDSRFEVEEVEALYRERQDKADAKARRRHHLPVLRQLRRGARPALGRLLARPGDSV